MKMKGRTPARIRYFYEYAFADAMNTYNGAHPDTRIMVSEGRTLHEKMLDELGNMGFTLQDAPIAKFQQAFNLACGKRMGRNFYRDERKRDTILNAQLFKFNSLAKFDGIESVDGVLPVSPYDARFCDRDTIRRNGSKILYMRANEIDDIENAANFVAGRKVNLCDFYEDRNGNPVYKNIGLATTKADMNGTSMLMAYMSQDEYEAIEPWVGDANANINWDDMSDEDIVKFVNERHIAMEKSVAILSGLREMGIPYTITKDQYPGQVRASLTGTKISVRITDTPENQLYVGRVYDNGGSVYYSTTRKKGTTTVRYSNPTPEDCLNLVKFALNQPVKRKDSRKLVGEPDKYNITYYRNVNGKLTKNTMRNNAAVQGNNVFSAIAGAYVDEKGEVDKYGHKIVIRTNLADRSANTSYFKDGDDAREYLEYAVESARANLENTIDAERIIREYHEHADDENYIPEYSGDTAIAAIQQGYWDILTGRESTLLIPGEIADEYEENVGEVGEFRNDTPAERAMTQAIISEITYSRDDFASPEDMIRRHVSDSVNHMVGHFDRDNSGKRFDPVGVSKYMTSPYGVSRNNNDIVEALKLAGIGADGLKGSDYYNRVLRDMMIEFDESTAVQMNQSDVPFVKSIGDEVVQALRRSGCEVNPDDVRMDANGIIHYKASSYKRMAAADDGADKNAFEGEIGQVFIPDEEGKLETKFAGSDNYICVPGYEAYIVPQKPGESKTVAERTRLRGYEQIMRNQIRYQIRQDVLEMRSKAGTTTSCNGVYRRLYDHRYSLDFAEQYEAQGMDDSLIHAIVRTEASRVRYDNDIRENSTINADYNASRYGSFDMTNDNFGDAYCLTGGKNMSIMDENGDGYFDPVATGTSTNQGITRYLVEGAVVNPDGTITPSDNPNARTPLLAHDICKFMDYNPFDRQQMTVSNLLQASAVTKPVKVAQMTFGGWTQDDPVVVSSKFAHNYQIRNNEGIMRDLVIGDKVSDLNGNKGVISLVVDPDMDLDEAKKLGIREQVEWFKANPDLDVVMAPFPAVSRFNGGSTRELMQNPSDLVAPNGNVHKGCVGEMQMIITDKSADVKTHVYDDEDIMNGKGRKVSAQLAWALNSQDCSAIMAECFGNNNGAVSNLREMLILMGLDMDETGNLRTEYAPHEGETRRVFEIPELSYTSTGAVDLRKMRSDFGDAIGRSGGIMEIPFELEYVTGSPVPPMNDGKTDVIYKADEWTRKGYTRKDGVYVRPTVVHRHNDANTARKTSDMTYGLPVLSSYLRCGQEFEDGTATTHDYTNQYLMIFEQSIRYVDAKNRLNNPNNKDSAQRGKWENELLSAKQKAQAAYNSITQDMIQRKFEGKHNVFRDDLMSHRMPASSTSIWTADPRLDIDQIAVGTSMAEKLDVKDNDYVLCWRDPVLRDSGVRYMRVKVDDNLTGVAISPVMDKCFDGDFDGDTIGIVRLKTRAAQKEAMEKLTFDANLLDYGSKNEKGLYELAMQNSLDIKVAQHYNPALAEHWDKITREVNELERLAANEEISDDTLRTSRKNNVEEISNYYRECYANQCGAAVVSYDSMQSHIESLVHGCVETGAKGSMSKIHDYLKYLGVECELKDDKFDYSTLRDNGKTLSTRSDLKDVQYATAVKAFGTGVAGKYSQRGVRGLRNDCQKAVLELTYPTTQAILQAKHDPIDARHKYQMLMSTCRSLWRGYVMEYDERSQDWKVPKGPDGKPFQADTEAWKKQFLDVYSSEHGLNININPEYVDAVAKAMTRDGFVQSIDGVIAEDGALMDRLAYGGTFKSENPRDSYANKMSVVEAAKNGENIFDGKYNRMFVPRVIRNNQEIEQNKVLSKIFDNPEYEKEGRQVKGVVKSDVREDSVRKAPTKPVAVGGKRVPDNILVSQSATPGGISIAE